MEDREGRAVRRRAQVGKEAAHLRSVEKAFVHDGARGEAADVEAVEPLRGAAALGRLLREVEFFLELVVGDAVEAGDEGLRDQGHGIDGFSAEDGEIDRHFAPGDEGEALFLHGLDEDLARLRLGELAAARQEDHADAEVLVRRGGLFLLLEIAAENIVRELSEHARAVAGDGVGVDGAAVGEAFERREGARQHVVRALAVDLRDEAHAASVVLELRVVQRRRAQRAQMVWWKEGTMINCTSRGFGSRAQRRQHVALEVVPVEEIVGVERDQPAVGMDDVHAGLLDRAHVEGLRVDELHDDDSK